MKYEYKTRKCRTCKEEFKYRKAFNSTIGISANCPECVKAKKFKHKSERQLLVKKIDIIWSKVVRGRDGKCMYCGATGLLNAHHIFGRVNYATRWDLQNGISLCPDHHKFSKEMSAHETPTMFTDWLRDTRGDAFLKELERKSRVTVTTTPAFRSAHREHLLRELNKYK